VTATVSKLGGTLASEKEFEFMGDIKKLSVLGPPDEVESYLLTDVPDVFAVGQVISLNKDQNTFTIEVKQWTPFIQKGSEIPLTTIVCFLEDKKKWQSSKKPFPNLHSIAHVYGALEDIVIAQSLDGGVADTAVPPTPTPAESHSQSEPESLGFRINVEDVTFLGAGKAPATPQNSPSKSGAGTRLKYKYPTTPNSPLPRKRRRTDDDSTPSDPSMPLENTASSSVSAST